LTSSRSTVLRAVGDGMSRAWLRLTVAVLFVLVWSAPFYIDAANINKTTGSDLGGLPVAVLLVVWVALTLLTGFIVRWPALVLPIVIFLVLIPLGANPEDHDGWPYAGLFLVPAGFLSFFVLGAGWLGRIGFDHWLSRRGSRPRDTDETQRGADKMLLIPLGLLCVAGLLLLALIHASTSTDVKSPCQSGEDRLIDPQVAESPNEVVVRASLEIHYKFPCDSGTARDAFTVHLQHPLGNRTVIDDSRGLRSVIWPKPAGFVGLP